MICDFCFDPRPVWDYPAAPMELVGHYSYSVDGFAVCVGCHQLIVRGDIIGLAERIVTMQPVHVPPGEHREGGIVVYGHVAVRRRLAMQNILRFQDARLGPPRRLREEAR